ncbi:MAG: site-specific integrase [Actinomycetota bacterium]|nr:site-specific integrase [Actinomycetota bacterium]
MYGRTRAEVAHKLRLAQQAAAEGRLVLDERRTLGAYLDWWLTEEVALRVRESTAVSYKQKVRHIQHAIGRVRLSRLGPVHVDHLLKDLHQAGLSPRGVQYVHAVLRSALQKAEQLGLIGRNVAGLVKPPPVPRFEVRPLTVEEAKELLKAVDGHRLSALYAVALAVGLRAGEALGLSWEDIDLDAGTLRVRRSLQRLNGRLVYTPPKSKNAARTIALPPALVATLQAHRTRQAAERLRRGDGWRDHGLVFPSEVGTPLEPRNLTRHFHETCKKAGLDRRRFHDLRHTCGSLLAAQGVHPRVAMEILGHSQIRLTMEVYTHVASELQREATGRVQDLLG